MSRRVVIVGGGIAGLTAMEQLSRVPNIDVTLLEAADRLGGHIRTDRDDGFITEAGPDVILAAKPAAVALAKRVGLEGRLRGTNPAAKGSYILSGRRLRRLPDGLTGLVPSRMAPFATTPLLSVAGKLRVGLDYFIAPREDKADESIERFVVRRLGHEMYERLVEPLLSGISAGDGARLSVEAMFPQLKTMEREHGGLVRGMLAARRRATGAPRDANAPSAMGFLSFENGLQELSDAVAADVRTRTAAGRAACSIRTGARVARVARIEHAFRIDLAGGGSMDADAVIIAAPAFAAAGLLRDVDPELCALLSQIEYVSTVTVSVAYPEISVPRPLDATGYVVPRVLGRPVLACTWASTKFLGRAPKGFALFRVFLGGAGRGSFAEADDRALRELARAELRDIMGVTADPVLERIRRFPRAMPQYNVGHLDRVARIEAAVARTPGLALAGAAYRGVGIPDCVRSGERAAEDILRQLDKLVLSEIGSTQ